VKVALPELLWYGNSTLEIDLPDSWDVTAHRMRGATAPALTVESMADAVKHPAGRPLRELARGKRKAVIIFDDMTRPTRMDQLGPIVLSELTAAGMREEQISFVCALGTHGALTLHELRKKVGPAILERFRVYNHNCYEHCVEIGTTRYGTKLAVNREVMSADLKIGIGCVTAHAQTGFSGGGKIILPGVSHIDSIAHYHIDVQNQAPQTTGLGRFDDNVMRLNFDEAARMAGLDFKIDVVVNERCEATHLFAGDFLEAHRRAVVLAKEHYATEPLPSGKDVMISNAFCKPNEMPIAVLVGALGLEGLQGTVVVIANAPEGQVVHYLLGRFGEGYGGRQHPVAQIPSSVNLIIQSPQVAKTSGDWFANPEAITWSRSWAETRRLLEKTHGRGTRAGIIPNATMAYHKFG